MRAQKRATHTQPTPHPHQPATRPHSPAWHRPAHIAVTTLTTLTYTITAALLIYLR